MQAFSAVIVGRLTVLRQQRSLQKCLAHLERELKALETSRFAANREFAERVFPILHTARQAHRDYHQGQLNLAQLQEQRPLVEAQLAQVLDTPTDGRWAADSQNLANRLRRHRASVVHFFTSSRGQARS